MDIPEHKFFHDLNSEDETGLLIRTHLHIERVIREYINRHVPHPKHLPRLTYEAALRLACALGLNEKFLAPLKELGDLRNHFGHSHDAVLDEEKVNRLLSRFSEPYRELIVNGYEETRRQGKIRGPLSFNELHPVNKFGLIALLLRENIVDALDGQDPGHNSRN